MMKLLKMILIIICNKIINKKLFNKKLIQKIKKLSFQSYYSVRIQSTFLFSMRVYLRKITYHYLRYSFSFIVNKFFINIEIF